MRTEALTHLFGENHVLKTASEAAGVLKMGIEAAAADLQSHADVFAGEALAGIVGAQVWDQAMPPGNSWL